MLTFIYEWHSLYTTSNAEKSQRLYIYDIYVKIYIYIYRYHVLHINILVFDCTAFMMTSRLLPKVCC